MSKSIFWLPRIIMVGVIILMFAFSLDVFAIEGTVLERTLGFLIHNIPVFILTCGLLLAWVKPLSGGFFLVLAAFIFTVYFKAYQHLAVLLLFSVPIFLSGLLFVLFYLFCRKNRSAG